MQNENRKMKIANFVWRRRLISILLLVAPTFCVLPASAQTRRVVILKVDGLPYEMIDRFARERDPLTGKSRLPWFDHVFYANGTRITNFYVRGMSLSAPSWSLIDTGQHLQIKGNVEFDRCTMQTYDYLNFIPFYIDSTIGPRIDMVGVEVLDSVGVPLLTDAFPHNERFATLSLFQRAPRYITFQKALENKLKVGP